MKYEDFPQMCVKCKKKDVPLNKFTYARSRRISSREITSVFISFPVCDSCQAEFEKSYKFEKYFNYLKYPALISFLVAIFFGYRISNGSTFWVEYLLLFVAMAIIIVEII